MKITKCVLAVSLGILCTILPGTLRADTFILQGVTLADGGTITGQFDWNDTPGSYVFTNVNIQVTGGGAQTGLNPTITSDDTMNPGGLCFSDPPLGTGLCESSSLVFIFDQRLTPNTLNPGAPQQLSDTICLGNTSCFGGDQSEFTFSDGASVAITGGSVVNTTVPEPSSLILLASGLAGITRVIRRRVTK